MNTPQIFPSATQAQTGPTDGPTQYTISVSKQGPRPDEDVNNTTRDWVNQVQACGSFVATPQFSDILIEIYHNNKLIDSFNTDNGYFTVPLEDYADLYYVDPNSNSKLYLVSVVSKEFINSSGEFYMTIMPPNPVKSENSN